ncbi:MAG: hypothetical protein V3S37_02320 [Dehalococcoidia bacterium]
MLLTKSRIPIVATVLILLLGFILIIGQASGDDADGPVGSEFDSDVSEVVWDWSGSGQAGSIEILLGASLDGIVFSIEVFVEPDTSTQAILEGRDEPVHIERMGNSAAFPTERVLSFNFSSPRVQLVGGTTDVGIHLHGTDGTRILADDTVAAIPTPTPTAVPPAAPTPTPVVTTEVPASDITPVSAPTGGGVVIIQPSTGASVSTEDGNIGVTIPSTANATTFQLAIDPSPADVPEPPAGTVILQAFALNAYDADGTLVSLQLIKPVTITVKYTADDLAAANGNAANLKVLRYDAITQSWNPLFTTPNLAAMTLTATVQHLSMFATASVEPLPQAVGTPTPQLPVPGDITPGSGLVLALILTGFLLIIGGGLYVAQILRLKS